MTKYTYYQIGWNALWCVNDVYTFTKEFDFQTVGLKRSNFVFLVRMCAGTKLWNLPQENEWIPVKQSSNR